MEEYPYFLYPLLEELKDCPDTSRAATIRERIAAGVGEHEILRRLIGESASDLEEDDQIASGNRKQQDPIDAFISLYGESAELPQGSFLAQLEEETAPEESHDIDYETLREAVKNKEYDHALALLTQFNLNNPKKSVYFADQIRFIRKMMYNESKTDKTKKS